jgi:hypothetical protein
MGLSLEKKIKLVIYNVWYSFFNITIMLLIMSMNGWVCLSIGIGIWIGNLLLKKNDRYKNWYSMRYMILGLMNWVKGVRNAGEL